MHPLLRKLPQRIHRSISTLYWTCFRREVGRKISHCHFSCFYGCFSIAHIYWMGGLFTGPCSFFWHRANLLEFEFLVDFWLQQSHCWNLAVGTYLGPSRSWPHKYIWQVKRLFLLEQKQAWFRWLFLYQKVQQVRMPYGLSELLDRKHLWSRFDKSLALPDIICQKYR